MPLRSGERGSRRLTRHPLGPREAERRARLDAPRGRPLHPGEARLPGAGDPARQRRVTLAGLARPPAAPTAPASAALRRASGVVAVLSSAPGARWATTAPTGTG
ncbi:hypothetical protein NL676_031668 [Syzygium grande]|nr:hypothetical protein NL676_031668 [Syzygium grande]